jgi:hypothetical protein
MKLLPNEQKLITSNNDKVILTDHRIYMTEKEWGQSYSNSIFLEDVRSIETKYKSYIMFIILGVLFFLASIFFAGQTKSGGLFLFGIIICIVFFGTWMLTRKHVISITSVNGTSLNILVKSMSEDAINNFVYRVSLAKQERLKLLHKI